MRAFLCLALVFALWAPSLDGGDGPVVGPIEMTVSDVDRSADFYRNVLDFRKVADREFTSMEESPNSGLFAARIRQVDLRLGRETIRLTAYLNYPGRPIPSDSNSNDRWFQHVAIVASDMDRAYARLRKHGVKPSSPEPQRLPDWNPNAGGIRAFYFRDPDNHNLEVIWFPAGKGDSRWQQSGSPLFQGIDHTAIVVRDTGASLHFYRDRLGFRVAGESRNSGMEQSRLNRVQDASLRITGLRGSSGPGVELLEYLHPRDGRAYPESTRPNDLWFWQINLRMLGDHSNRLVRDPDRHAVFLQP